MSMCIGHAQRGTNMVNKKINELETSVYEARCMQCKWYMCLMSKHAIQNNSEAHMMETGHTVKIVEVN